MRHYYENYFQYPWLWFLAGALACILSIGNQVYCEEQKKYAIVFTLLEVGMIYILWKIFRKVGGWVFWLSLVFGLIVLFGLNLLVHPYFLGLEHCLSQQGGKIIGNKITFVVSGIVPTLIILGVLVILIRLLRVLGSKIK